MRLEKQYGITIDWDGWTLEEMLLFAESLSSIVDYFESTGVPNGIVTFKEIWGGTKFKRVSKPCGWSNVTACARGDDEIQVGDQAFINFDGTARDEKDVIGTFVHELAHIWDNRSNEELSRDLQSETGGTYKCFLFIFRCRYAAVDSPASEALQAQGNRTAWNHKEDFAETFQALVVSPGSVTSSTRVDYFTDLLDQ